uniref:Adenosine deaminase n=1 Tax=Timema shepardi TaxID=629360 RepID=A0A7R9G1U1_TIMSH|nr:unnamed protein product [Timema shepardi]
MYQVLPVFQKVTLAFAVVLVLSVFSNATHEDSYYKQRNNFISQEQKRFLGSEIVLTAREEAVNSLLMESKRQEFQRGMDMAGTFPPSRHFFLARHDIEQSSVFSLIRRMPKEVSCELSLSTKEATGLLYELFSSLSVVVVSASGYKSRGPGFDSRLVPWVLSLSIRGSEFGLVTRKQRLVSDLIKIRISPISSNLATFHLSAIWLRLGASLHGHTFSLASTNFLIKNLTYLPQLYVCVDTAGVLNFKFSEKVPDDNCDWVLLEMLRASSGNATFVDEFIRKQITLETDHPTDIFTTVNGLTRWRVAFEMYYNQVLKEFYEDNVMYLEIRGTIPKIYDLDGTIMHWKDFLTLMSQLNKQFSALHPDFLGTKLIISPSRTINDSVMDADIQRVVEAHRAFPDLVVGFDLVGQEDKGKSLLNFTDKLLHLPPGIDFFFHAGETNWEGVTDMNLVDAVLMNATRIGHGYALNKHPLVLEKIKEKDIGIEVNPISNQVLMLVEDLRNHPAATLLADDYPVVISPDDPSFWGAKGLSYDMYEAFMGMAGVEADLKLLKQLAINSIK